MRVRSHRFGIGERVRYQSTNLTTAQTGIYEVLALLPDERGSGFQYRLRSTADNHQRVALEDALSQT